MTRLRSDHPGCFILGTGGPCSALVNFCLDFELPWSNDGVLDDFGKMDGFWKRGQWHYAV
jgi:hypothetical protein